MQDAVIVSAVRTPVGKAPNGSLRFARPDDMAATVITEALRRAPGIDPTEIDDVILGCAMPEAEQGLNVARIASLRAGIPHSASAVTVNRFCSSGLQAIAFAAERIMCGFAHVIVAGGTESMSLIPMGGHKIAPNPTLVDTYPDVYLTTGLVAENHARESAISREAQDAYALESHRRAIAAIDAGRFRDEIVPLEVAYIADPASAANSTTRAPAASSATPAGATPAEATPTPFAHGTTLVPTPRNGTTLVPTPTSGTTLAPTRAGAADSRRRIDASSPRVETRRIDTDEGPRRDTSPEALAKLKPAFHANGSVTAGNSSQTSDGAAAAIVMSADRARALNRQPLARFVTFATAGVDPERFGIGPVPAIKKALALAGLSLDDIGLIELNEAFAAQVLACLQALPIDPARLNVNGGAIALGHPLGCTGAKLTATLLHEMQRRNVRYGMVTMCVGGGMGAAGIFERM